LVKMNTRGQKKKRKSTTKTSSLEAATQEDTPPPMVTTVQDTDDNIPSTSGAVMHPVVTNRQECSCYNKWFGTSTKQSTVYGAYQFGIQCTYLKSGKLQCDYYIVMVAKAS
ncbi:Hypothetical predicted protein, partial [Mytilus galloprovincialis]